ncbi:MAG: pyridoxamine 5'-phosphate oxidase family protein [Chloroflexota bacterium]|nr:pyridoxamine 5'-phosphate oxidase family protein [Chloroflexota bacterium]
MTTKQGDLSLINDPVAQQLLQSTIPARFAYTWTDGTPRVIPIGFHWNGEEIVLGTPPDAPKMKALKDGAKVALTIDSDRMPHKVLLIRGTARIDTVEGVAPEYAAMSRRVMGEEAGEAWVAQVSSITPRMSRVFIRPEWVAVMDFETRFPNALERAMERAQAG